MSESGSTITFDNLTNASVVTDFVFLKAFQHIKRLPFPENDLVISAPERAWNPGGAAALSGSIESTISFSLLIVACNTRTCSWANASETFLGVK